MSKFGEYMSLQPLYQSLGDYMILPSLYQNFGDYVNFKVGRLYEFATIMSTFGDYMSLPQLYRSLGTISTRHQSAWLLTSHGHLLVTISFLVLHAVDILNCSNITKFI